MEIRIVCLGKLKEPFLKEGCTEFIKRLDRHVKLQLVELQDEKVQADVNRLLVRECERILPHLQGYVIVLDEHGKLKTSQEFSQILKKHEMERITFVIGSSHGLAEEIKQKAQLQLAFGIMTWPHQMARMLLLEQIYRGVCILKNIPYHK